MGLSHALVLLLGSAGPTPLTYESGLAEALILYDAGRFADAGELLGQVFAVAATLDERRTAATRALGAYTRAFEVGERPAAAAYLCDGLAIADAFLLKAPTAASLARTRAQLAELRAPFGPCIETPKEWLVVPAGGPVKLAVAPRPAAPSPQVSSPKDTARSRAARPNLAWPGVALLVTGIGGVAAAVGIGVSEEAAAARTAETLTANAAGRAFTNTELTQLSDARGRLEDGKTIVVAGSVAGAAVAVVGAVFTAFGWRRPNTRRAALRSGPRGASLTWSF